MIKLFPDQERIVEQVVANLDKDILVQSPAGSGKTYIIAYLTKVLEDAGYKVAVVSSSVVVKDQLDRLFYDLGIVSTGGVNGAIKTRDYDGHIDFLLIDEAHHSEAETWQKFIDKHSEAKKIGFTATPTRLDGKPLENSYDILITGETVGNLIKQGRLSPFDYYAPSVSDAIHNIINVENLNVSGEQFYIQSKKRSWYKKTIYSDVVKTWFRLAKGKQTLLFAPSIEMSKQYAKAFQKVGVKAEHIDGAQPNYLDCVNDFRNKGITILCSVNIISEGFDMPDVECVILTRPTESLALFHQQCFRALRYKKGKRAIILDHVDNVAHFGNLDDPIEWTLEGREKGKGTEIERTVWDKWFSEAVYDESVDLEKVVRGYTGVYDNMIKKALELKNMDGLTLLFDIQKDLGIVSTGKTSWAYAFAKEHGFDLPFNL